MVESEKSAIIAAGYHPDFIWLATGGKTQFKYELLLELKDRYVAVYPDLGSLDDWQEKITRYNFPKMEVRDLLERYASEKDISEGLDLADYLLKFPPGELVSNTKPKLVDQEEYLQGLKIENDILITKDGYPAKEDLQAPYLNSQTKNFIAIALTKNKKRKSSNAPVILELYKRLDLKILE